MPTYVKTPEGDTWHWCKNCSKYPHNIGERRSTRPEWDLCEECKDKEKLRTCQE